MPETTRPFLPLPTTPKRDWRKCCFFVSLFLSLSVTLSLVVLVVVLYEPKTETPKLREKGGVCFVCDYLGSEVESKDTLYELVKTEEHTMCCLGKNDKLSEAFIKVIANQLDDKTEEPTNWTSIFFNRTHAVGAHFYLNKKLSTDISLFWERATYKGISFYPELGSTIIPSAGRYLVYSQITYMQNHHDSKGRDSFLHRVTRKHPGQPNLGEITLLQNRETFSKDITSPGSSYLTAILQLHKNDQLSVRISDLKSVSHRALSNYFGILKLS